MCEGDYKKNVVKTSHLEAFVLLCIILNVISMAMAYEGASEQYNSILKYLNTVFTGVFILEAIIKIIAYGFFTYIRNGWN